MMSSPNLANLFHRGTCWKNFMMIREVENVELKVRYFKASYKRWLLFDNYYMMAQQNKVGYITLLIGISYHSTYSILFDTFCGKRTAKLRKNPRLMTFKVRAKCFTYLPWPLCLGKISLDLSQEVTFHILSQKLKTFVIGIYAPHESFFNQTPKLTISSINPLIKKCESLK